MKVTLNSLSSVKRVIIVLCNNRWGLHDSAFVRYIILIGEDMHALWVDSPSEQEVIALMKHFDKDIQTEALSAPCPFCQSRESTNPEDIT